MQMDAGLDTGPVLLRASTPIGGTETTGELHDRLSTLGARLILEALEQLPELTPVPQPEDGITYAAKITKAEARIDWSRPASELVHHINGLSPFPGAFTEIAGERIKLLRATLAEGQGTPGERIEGFTVACGSGALRVLDAQREGKKPMPAAEILRGKPLPAMLG